MSIFLLENTDYEVANALPIIQSTSLEQQVSSLKHLKSLFEIGQKSTKTTVIVQHISNDITLEKEFKQLLYFIPPKLRPKTLIIFSEENKFKHSTVFKSLPRDKFIEVGSYNKLIKELSPK